MCKDTTQQQQHKVAKLLLESEKTRPRGANTQIQNFAKTKKVSQAPIRCAMGQMLPGKIFCLCICINDINTMYIFIYIYLNQTSLKFTSRFKSSSRFDLSRKREAEKNRPEKRRGEVDKAVVLSAHSATHIFRLNYFTLRTECIVMCCNTEICVLCC